MMEAEKHENQIQQEGAKFILEIKVKVMWEQEEMGMGLNKRTAIELSLKRQTRER